MQFILIDKNLLVPEIVNETNLINIINQFYKIVYKRDSTYYSNVYVVRLLNNEYNGIINWDGANFILTDNTNFKEKIKVNFNYIFSKNENLNTVTNNPVTASKKPVLNDNFETKPMQLVINEVNQIQTLNLNNQQLEHIKPEQIPEQTKLEPINPVESEEEKIKREEKEKKKELLIKTCEQVMDMYNLELSNIKKTENKIKSLNSKLEKLEKKKQEQIIKDVTRTKSDYETWKKLKYNIPRDKPELILKPEEELELKENPQIPILFTAKYNYIENALKNSRIKEMYEFLNKLDVDQLYLSDTININENILKYCEKYYQIAKKDLHYKFDHDWDYLDTEMNTDSKGSSLSLFE